MMFSMIQVKKKKMLTYPHEITMISQDLLENMKCVMSEFS